MAVSCPRCSTGPTSVRETRGARRTRRCQACGTVFYTQEVFEEEVVELRRWREQYRQLVEAMEVLMTAPAPNDATKN